MADVIAVEHRGNRRFDPGKRRERNWTRYHLAIRMGIATALLRSWENNASQPDQQHLEMLAQLLRFDPAKPYYFSPRAGKTASRLPD